MAISLDIKSELPKAIKWTNEHTKQLPFSISQAMNASVSGRALRQAKQRNAFKALEGASKQYLDRPKLFTSKGFFATTAKKRNLQILVTPKDLGGDRERYLSGNILGTTRAVKGNEVEFATLSKGDITRGTKFVPTRHMKKDRYGNVSQSNLVKIVNSVGNTGRTGSNIFIGKPMRARRHNDITSFSVIGQAVLTEIFYQFFIIEIGQIIKRAHIILSKREHHPKANIFKSAQIV